MFTILAAEAQTIDWGTVLVQSIITLGAIFGGAGFWQYKQSKLQAKRDEESKKSGVENKVDKLTDNVAILNKTVGTMSDDLIQIKDDVEILHKANEETLKYRELRDARDKEALKVQAAVIVSLKGMLRERLLDNYQRCKEKGYYTKEERETYGELFKCYEQEPFDGNGIMHQLQPIMQAMPWTEEEAKATTNIKLKKPAED